MDTEVEMRASFTGELARFITPNHVTLWKRIFHHGNVFDLFLWNRDYLLRAEKGYVVISRDRRNDTY